MNVSGKESRDRSSKWKHIFPILKIMYKFFILFSILCFILGSCVIDSNYDKGLECYKSKKYTEAVKYFEKSANGEKGFLWGHNIFSDDEELQTFYYLGICYHYGRGVKEDHSVARQWFQKAVDSEGISPIKKFKEESMCRIGLYYINGDAVKKDYEQAVRYFELAVKENDNYGPALYRMGYFYYYGLGVKKDYEQAVKWLQESLLNSSLNYVSREHYPDENYEYDAHFLLGECFYYGRGVKKDYSEAMKHYNKSSSDTDIWGGMDVKNPDAFCALGRCYEKGHGVEKDENTALSYYTIAAEEGNATAQCWLGYRCRMNQNYAESVKWYQKAADQNNPEGLKWLALHYREGCGVDKDTEKAKELEEKAKILQEKNGED